MGSKGPGEKGNRARRSPCPPGAQNISGPLETSALPALPHPMAATGNCCALGSPCLATPPPIQVGQGWGGQAGEELRSPRRTLWSSQGGPLSPAPGTFYTVSLTSWVLVLSPPPPKSWAKDS